MTAGFRRALVLMEGPPGSGTSTLASALAAERRWPVLDIPHTLTHTLGIDSVQRAQ